MEPAACDCDCACGATCDVRDAPVPLDDAKGASPCHIATATCPDCHEQFHACLHHESRHITLALAARHVARHAGGSCAAAPDPSPGGPIFDFGDHFDGEDVAGCDDVDVGPSAALPAGSLPMQAHERSGLGELTAVRLRDRGAAFNIQGLIDLDDCPFSALTAAELKHYDSGEDNEARMKATMATSLGCHPDDLDDAELRGNLLMAQLARRLPRDMWDQGRSLRGHCHRLGAIGGTAGAVVRRKGRRRAVSALGPVLVLSLDPTAPGVSA